MVEKAHFDAVVDVTDLIEFVARGESPSGVQRVEMGVLPDLISRGSRVTALDRGRGVLVELDPQEISPLTDSAALGRPGAGVAQRLIVSLTERPELQVSPESVVLFPGAVWINDSLMLAARGLHAAGARLVFYLYDLTPVLHTGHTAAVNMLYERYLTLVSATAARVPAISVSSRRDYEHWCSEHGYSIPAGEATGLPNAVGPNEHACSDSPWSRPYALFVGTIESRKNHIAAFEAWRRLIERHGRDSVPDLVCIGRLGWNADEFLKEFTSTNGLNGKVTILTSSVPDDELIAFYAHAEFSIYPSSYEGWGLPVSESLAFGVPVICTDNSSLREAGGSAAIYIPTADGTALANTVEKHFITRSDSAVRGSDLQALAPVPPTWLEVTRKLWQEMEAASSHKVGAMGPEIEIGREYALGVQQPAPDGAHADRFLEHLVSEGFTPLLSQPRDERDFRITDAALLGTFGAPQAWGLQLLPQHPCTIRFTRPTNESLTLLLSTRSMPGCALVETISPAGSQRSEVYLGGVISIPLGEGESGEDVQVRITVIDASDSVEGFVGIRSFVVLASEDLQGQLAVERAAAKALRQELDFVTGTRSWRITAPLRRWKGRGVT